MDDAGTWHGGRLSPGEFVLDGDPARLPQKGAKPSPPILRFEAENFEIGPEVGDTSGYS